MTFSIAYQIRTTVIYLCMYKLLLLLFYFIFLPCYATKDHYLQWIWRFINKLLLLLLLLLLLQDHCQVEFYYISPVCLNFEYCD